MKISACMIVKNESENIVQCINSFKDSADEIIVVDTGSTDDTVELAQKVGAKVYFREWDQDFSAAKNYALERASGEWIIFLDADEYFNEKSRGKIRDAIIKADKNTNIEAIACKMINLNKTDLRIIGQVSTIRMFRKDPSIRFEGKIHEAPKKNGAFLKYDSIGDLIIYHTGYSSDMMNSKLLRNLELLKKEALSGESDPLIYYYLAETYYKLNNYEGTVNYGTLFLNADKDNKMILSMSHTFRIYKYKIASMLALGFSYDNISLFIKTIPETMLFHPEIKNSIGDFLFQLGHYDQALEYYKGAVEENKKEFLIYSNSFNNTYPLTLNKMGEIYLIKGEKTAALDCFLKALKLEKLYSDALLHVLDIIKYQNAKEIILLLNSIYDTTVFEEVKFLTVNLAARKIKEPFLYYFLKKWQGGYEDYGLLMVTALIFTNDTKRALELAYMCYLKEKDEQYQLFTVVAMLYGNHVDWSKQKNSLSDGYAKLLKAYFSGTAILNFSLEEENVYVKILDELILFKNWDIVDRLLRLAQNADINEKIAAVFEKNDYYEFAIDYYKKALEGHKVDADKIKLYQTIAFCYFQLNQDEKSIEFYEKVSSDKNKGNDETIQFVQWIKQRTNN